jgi:general secretion pathway protein G
VFQRAYDRLQAAKKDQRGFTLIELLIVIVILGVLAGIVVFSVQFITNRGQVAACQTDLKNVESAFEAFYAQNAKYPVNGIGATGSNDPATLTGAGVLKEAPPTVDAFTVTGLPNGPVVVTSGLAGCN